MTTDAPNTAMGGGSSNGFRMIDSGIHVNETLKSREELPSTFDKELLAAYSAVRKFAHYLEGRAFIVFTYHKSLTFSMTSSHVERKIILSKKNQEI